MEIWKDIQGYESIYKVSNLGNIKSLDRVINCNERYLKNIIGKKLSLTKDKDGYLMCCLWKENKGKTNKVHRIVCSSFKENIKSNPQVNHIDGNKQNNKIENLEWVNNSENNKHAYKLGLKRPYQKKAVNVFDLTGKFLFDIDNMHEASRVTKVNRANISNVCKGVYKQCNGFKFKYKN
jgi:hypothetical protein